MCNNTTSSASAPVMEQHVDDMPGSIDAEPIPFSQVANWALDDTSISDGALRLYLILISYDFGKGSVFPSQATLAKRMGISERVVRRRVYELIDLDMISKNVISTSVRGGWSKNVYSLRRWSKPERLNGPEDGNVPSEPPDENDLRNPEPPDENDRWPEDENDRLRRRIEKKTKSQEHTTPESTDSGKRGHTKKPREPELTGEKAELAQRLNERVVFNGFKQPKDNAANRRAMRLLIDKDGYTPEQVRYIIDWSTSDHFWHQNIRSATTLREKFDQLVVRVKAQWNENNGGSASFGEINPDAVLGKDLWQLPAPPRDLPDDQYQAWAKNEHQKHKQERYEQAKRVLESRNQ